MRPYISACFGGWEGNVRLDKLLSEMGKAKRSEAGKLIRAGKVTVNGVAPKKPDFKVDPEKDTVVFLGEAITYKKFTYIMLNQPEGDVSASEDENE